MVIRTIHSSIYTAFSDVQTKLLIYSSCFTCMKKITTSHFNL